MALDISASAEHASGWTDYDQQQGKVQDSATQYTPHGFDVEQRDLELQVLAVLPVMLFTSRHDGSWDYVNPAFCVYTGLSLEMHMGWGWFYLIQEEDRATSYATWQEGIRSHSSFVMQYRLMGSDGNYAWFRIHMMPRYYGVSRSIRWIGIATSLDVELQLQAERILRHAAEQAHQESSSRLAIAAHELRSPLTILLGHAQLLQNELMSHTVVEPNTVRKVEALTDHAVRLNRLVNSLLEMAQIDYCESDTVSVALDFSSLVRHVVQTLQPTLSQHTIQLDMDMEPLFVIGDDLRLEQVFHNLLQNAVKYSPYGGEITVMVQAEDSQVRIMIRDHGIGIAESVKPYLFQRFIRIRTRKDVIPGLGIGLYICKAIIDMHRGTIDINSTEGHGTTVTVCLPRS